jgi:type IV secretory pathway VirB4 component
MAKKEMQNKKSPGLSTQAHLDVAEIREGTIVLRDGSLRAVLVVSSTNFSLKSGDEQNALIDSYQSFLNSLEYPIQILMQSRKLDIHSYLDKLRAVMQNQTNELLRLQTQEYIEYVAKLIEFASIMNKTFYVIVPYSPFITKDGIVQKITNLINPIKTISLKKQEFEAHREELYTRVSQIIGALSAMGLHTLTLDTEELVELLYNSYNFDTASPIQIKKIEELDLVKPQE